MLFDFYYRSVPVQISQYTFSPLRFTCDFVLVTDLIPVNHDFLCFKCTNSYEYNTLVEYVSFPVSLPACGSILCILIFIISFCFYLTAIQIWEEIMIRSKNKSLMYVFISYDLSIHVSFLFDCDLNMGERSLSTCKFIVPVFDMGKISEICENLDPALSSCQNLVCVWNPDLGSPPLIRFKTSAIILHWSTQICDLNSEIFSKGLRWYSLCFCFLFVCI